jgi:hypothetical protein
LGTRKKLIDLRLIDVSHSGSNIVVRVDNALDECSLTDKIFSFTLDNASANASAMTFLTPKFLYWFCFSASKM